MPRSGRLVLLIYLFVTSLFAASPVSELLPGRIGAVPKSAISSPQPSDPQVWKDFGFVRSESAQYGKLTVTAYQLKDTTGALAAWEWVRSADARPCQLASFCSADAQQTYLFDGQNYIVIVQGGPIAKPDVAALFKALPDARETALPAILTFIPRQDLVPNSSRYILGQQSLNAVAPELKSVQAGFDQGVEGHFTAYKLGNTQVRLALFYYPTPEMARIHLAKLRQVPGIHAKRSSVLLAAVLPPATDAQADTLLARIEYQARITWNDVPPPGPIKPLYQLLRNILFLSGLLTVLCLVAGLMYAAMRVYRRRYGQLESEEAMTTLNLHGE